MSKNDSVSSVKIQADNWSGCISIVLTLAPSSLSAPSMPSSIHVLVHRQSFLHVALQEAVLRLYKFAPVSSFSSLIQREEPGDENTCASPLKNTAVSQQEQQYPVCWFEDEDTQFALRWHLFVGVLWDMKKGNKRLPWKIRLHFTQYPSSQILPLDNGNVLQAVERFYMNSLKQALFLQYSSNKVAMNMSKQTHGQLWDSITTRNFQLYQQVNGDLQQNINTVNLLPIRVLVDFTKPPIQRPCRIAGNDTSESLTLGSLLADWCPELFRRNDDNGIETKQPDTTCTVQGIRVALSANLVSLWKSLCCPDHFLYILISTKT